jgi:hypothetical protein
MGSSERKREIMRLLLCLLSLYASGCTYNRVVYNGGDWKYHHEGGPLNDPVGRPEVWPRQ